MSRYTEQEDDVQFSEPIQPQKNVRCGISKIEKAEWEVKPKEKWTADDKENMREFVGQKFDACKMTLTISDDSVKTEHADAKPRLSIDDQFNIEPYPFPKNGAVQKMGRQRLYEFEAAFGFDPIFKANGVVVEPFITRTGSKVAPKIAGVKRVINPDFFDAYFDAFGNPIISNWIGKTVYADIEIETSEKFWAKNIIKKIVKAPAI